jgi:hypothetical protein
VELSTLEENAIMLRRFLATQTPAFLLSCLAATSIGCSDSGDETAAGSGSLTLVATGEDGAKDGFPFEEDGESVAFADDWTVSFSKVLVSLGNITLEGDDGKVALSSDEHYLVDLHAGDPELGTFDGLGARRWERLSYEVLPAAAGMTNVSGVPSADVKAMTDEGYNYWLEGTAEKGDASFTFAWGFKNPTSNSNCTNGSDDTQGVIIRDNATTEAELTFHLDHVFWSTLGTEEAELRFEAVAAAGREDGDISWEDLEAQQLASLVGLDGEPLLDEEGEPIVYNPGSVPLASQNLASFILASSSSMGHLNGEGLCTVAALK